MSVWQAILQGMIQGLTEFLPVSSSGHLSIFQYFTGLSGESGAFFSIVLHLGTLFAVILAFFPTIWGLICEAFAMLGDIFRGRFTFRRVSPKRKMIFLLIVSLLPLVFVVFLKDFYESFSTDDGIIVEGLCLIVTGILLTLACQCPDTGKNAASMKYSDALAIGLAQAIAPMPGISRSGSTVAVGMMMGLGKKFAVTFSFIMGIPAVLGAVILEIPEVVENGLTLPLHIVIIGFVTSLVFGLLAIALVNRLVVSDKFRYFAYYTLIAGAIVVILGIIELFSGHVIQQTITGMLA